MFCLNNWLITDYYTFSAWEFGNGPYNTVAIQVSDRWTSQSNHQKHGVHCQGSQASQWQREFKWLCGAERTEGFQGQKMSVVTMAGQENGPRSKSWSRQPTQNYHQGILLFTHMLVVLRK